MSTKAIEEKAIVLEFLPTCLSTVARRTRVRQEESLWVVDDCAFFCYSFFHVHHYPLIPVIFFFPVDFYEPNCDTFDSFSQAMSKM